MARVRAREPAVGELGREAFDDPGRVGGAFARRHQRMQPRGVDRGRELALVKLAQQAVDTQDAVRHDRDAGSAGRGELEPKRRLRDEERLREQRQRGRTLAHDALDRVENRLGVWRARRQPEGAPGGSSSRVMTLPPTSRSVRR